MTHVGPLVCDFSRQTVWQRIKAAYFIVRGRPFESTRMVLNWPCGCSHCAMGSRR